MRTGWLKKIYFRKKRNITNHSSTPVTSIEASSKKSEGYVYVVLLQKRREQSEVKIRLIGYYYTWLKWLLCRCRRRLYKLFTKTVLQTLKKSQYFQLIPEP